jgi:hypothetical protein
METKLTPENLTGWAYAKRFLSDLYGHDYLAEIWPERLGIRDLAALQAIGQDTPIYEAWMVCLSKAADAGDLITHSDLWFTAMREPREFWTGKKQTRFIIPPCHKDQYGDELVCFEPGGIMKRTTASADDFAAYLKKVGEAPSEYIAAWLDTFGIDTVDPEKAEIGKDQKATPWLIPHPDDPKPKQPWYTPARYFARDLVKDDSTLLQKKDLLANKVVKSLSDVGIYKRGGKLPLDPATVLKAFSNVSLG